MNLTENKNRIIDFSIYFALKHNLINKTFIDFNKGINLDILTHEDYIKNTNELVDSLTVNKTLNFNYTEDDADLSTISSLIEILINSYTNLIEFKFISDKEEINDEYLEYKSSYNNYKDLSISYLLLKLMANYGNFYSTVNEHINKIDNIYNISVENYKISSSETIKKLKNIYENKMFNELIDNNFQIIGFADKKGIGIDYISSLKDFLKFNSDKLTSNQPLEFTFQKNINYILTQYILNIDNETSKIFNLIKIKSTLKDKKFDNIFLEGYIDFLLDKNFKEHEIYYALNALLLNKLDEDNPRKFIELKQVKYFHMLYLFWMFDYIESNSLKELKRDSDFKFINDLQSTFVDYNQFSKYYNNRTIYSHQNTKPKHYPFNTIESTIENIKSTLLIDRGKLRPYE